MWRKISCKWIRRIASSNLVLIGRNSNLVFWVKFRRNLIIRDSWRASSKIIWRSLGIFVCQTVVRRTTWAPLISRLDVGYIWYADWRPWGYDLDFFFWYPAFSSVIPDQWTVDYTFSNKKCANRVTDYISHLTKCEGTSLRKAQWNLCKTLKVTREGVFRPMILRSNKFDIYSIYCKCKNLSPVRQTKTSIKLLKLIIKPDY